MLFNEAKGRWCGKYKTNCGNDPAIEGNKAASPDLADPCQTDDCRLVKGRITMADKK